MSAIGSQPPKDSNWPKDQFGQSEVAAQFWPLAVVIIALLSAALVPVLSGIKKGIHPEVIAYCAQDQVYAEPIFADFQKRTGIRVRAVYDSEAVKTVGLANRLLAERGHPQCDVFWSNEEMRTRQLAVQNVFRGTNGLAAFGCRSRRLVINTNRFAAASAPRLLRELTNAIWRGKIALAYPQFGTTSAHFHALRQAWGEPAWQTWCRALAANQPLLVDGNSVVVKIVGEGEAWIGLTDSDDITEGRQRGLPVLPLPVTDETLLIPNTVAVVRGAPHPAQAQQLFDYLQQSEVAERLVAASALEGTAATAPSGPTLKTDWQALLRDLDATTVKLNEIFLR